jgi:glucosylglycerate synthase
MGGWASAVGSGDWDRVRQIGRADLLVGIPCFNNASSVGHVVSSTARGLAAHFPGMSGVIVASDGGSTDGTREVVESTATPELVRKLAFQYQGIPGKGSAFRGLFEVARDLGVKACVVVDSDLRSITPDWVRLLAGPIVDGSAGYVAPFYIRYKYDGTITNSIAYPFTRALYGVSVRQPIGGDFGFSAKLLDHYLSQDVWESDVARFGIDIWMTTTAINEGFAVAQAQLGAKIHDAKDPAASLGPMFRQVVGTLFGLMGRYESRWRGVSGSTPAPLIGDAVALEPEAVPVTVSAMVQRFRAGYDAEAAFWASFLPAESMDQLAALRSVDDAEFSFPLDLWVKTVFDFAVAYNRSGLDRGHVVDSLTGLYYGRTAAFCLDTAEMSTSEVEATTIDLVARRFEEMKPYLLDRWDGRI